MNLTSHLSFSIIVMIVQDWPTPTVSSYHRWHPLCHYDAASLAPATNAAEGAFKQCTSVCVYDYAGNKGLRVTGFNNGKCEAWERWGKQAGSAQSPQLGGVPAHTNTRKHTLGWLLEQPDAPIHTNSKDGRHTWSRGCDKWMELWKL